MISHSHWMLKYPGSIYFLYARSLSTACAMTFIEESIDSSQPGTSSTSSSTQHQCVPERQIQYIRSFSYPTFAPGFAQGLVLGRPPGHDVLRPVSPVHHCPTPTWSPNKSPYSQHNLNSSLSFHAFASPVRQQDHVRNVLQVGLF